MVALAAFVLGGAIITTLVQAEEMDAARAAPPGYLQPALYQHSGAQTSRHGWLRPANVQSYSEASSYHVNFRESHVGEADRRSGEPQARVSFKLGDLRRGRDSHSRSLMSDWERDQYRRNGAVFSMSVGKRW